MDILSSENPWNNTLVLIIIGLFLLALFWKLLAEKTIAHPNTLKFALIILSTGILMMAVFVPSAEKLQTGIVGLAGTILGYAFGKPFEDKKEK